jgi:hypothetical protein
MWGCSGEDFAGGGGFAGGTASKNANLKGEDGDDQGADGTDSGEDGDDTGEDGDGDGGDGLDGGGDSDGDDDDDDVPDEDKDTLDIDMDDLIKKGLLEPMTVKQTGGADEGAKITISVVAKDGDLPGVTQNLKEGSKTFENSCKKKGITTVRIELGGQGGASTAVAGENWKWTRMGDGIKIHIDMDGCGSIGTCLDPGKDDQFVFECRGGRLEVEGLGL